MDGRLFLDAGSLGIYLFIAALALIPLEGYLRVDCIRGFRTICYQHSLDGFRDCYVTITTRFFLIFFF